MDVVPQIISKTKQKAVSTPERVEAAVNKAAEKAKDAPNPEQQIKNDSETIAQNMGQPDQAEKIEKAIEDKVEAASGQETEEGDPLKQAKEKYGKQIGQITKDESSINLMLRFIAALMSQGLLQEGSLVDLKKIFKSKGMKVDLAKVIKAAFPDKNDRNLFIKLLTGPDVFDKFSKVIFPTKDDPAPTDGTADDKVVDPDPEKLKALEFNYIKFRDEFYKQKKLTEQAKLVTALLKALSAFNKEEEEEAEFVFAYLLQRLASSNLPALYKR